MLLHHLLVPHAANQCGPAAPLTLGVPRRRVATGRDQGNGGGAMSTAVKRTLPPHLACMLDRLLPRPVSCLATSRGAHR